MTRQERRKRRRQRRRPDASRYPPLARPRAGAHYRTPGGQGAGDTRAGNPARGGTANAGIHSTLRPCRRQRREETPEEPEEPPVEPEPENRYAELHFSDEDVYILGLGLVYHEARGESFEGQVAVVEVVLNRMLSDYFPDTVEEVVFQKYGDVWQFSPAPYLYSAEPDKEQYLAVHTAIEEREHILSEDTVYFSTAPYNESVDMIIGNHYFCKIF